MGHRTALEGQTRVMNRTCSLELGVYVLHRYIVLGSARRRMDIRKDTGLLAYCKAFYHAMTPLMTELGFGNFWSWGICTFLYLDLDLAYMNLMHGWRCL